jgi:hypothetical protein
MDGHSVARQLTVKHLATEYMQGNNRRTGVFCGVGAAVDAMQRAINISLQSYRLFSVWSVRKLCNYSYKYNRSNMPSCDSPCGGGVEYLHRDPASRRRRRKGKSQI